MTSFVDTRSRTTDAATSRAAARNAATHKANTHRAAIALCLKTNGPMTPRQIAAWTGLDYVAVQRRMSETGGIEVTDVVRDGCRVWRAVEGCYFMASGADARRVAA